MPFFQSHAKFSTTNNVWIWVVSSITSTALAFAAYVLIIHRQRKQDEGPSFPKKLNIEDARPFETILPSKLYAR